METRTSTRHDDAIAIARWEGEGGARKSLAEEEHDTRAAWVDAESLELPADLFAQHDQQHARGFGRVDGMRHVRGHQHQG